MSGDDFEVSVEQDGRHVPTSDNGAVLRKAPFTLVFLIQKGQGILVNAAPGPESIEMLSRSDDQNDIPGFEYTGMAEAQFNPNEELIISRKSAHYWHYDTPQDHRFSTVDECERHVLARRRISRFTTLDPRESLPVEKTPFDMVYLSFGTGRWFETRDGTKAINPVYRGYERMLLKKKWLVLRFSEADTPVSP